MNLTELKKKPIGELIKIAEFMGLEGMARNRKQDIIFAILKRHAMNGEEIFGDGVLEILSDGFGFLRSAAGFILPVQMTSTSARRKSVVLTYVLAIPLPVPFVHRKKVNVILLYSK